MPWGKPGVGAHCVSDWGFLDSIKGQLLVFQPKQVFNPNLAVTETRTKPVINGLRLCHKMAARFADGNGPWLELHRDVYNEHTATHHATVVEKKTCIPCYECLSSGKTW